MDLELQANNDYYIKVFNFYCNKIVLKIPYSGPIAKKLSGLYLTQYTTLDGHQKYAAVTQMEPTDARRMVKSNHNPYKNFP